MDLIRTFTNSHKSDTKKLLIVIPYRDRKHHLDKLLSYLTLVLQDQAITHYKIVSVEQTPDKLFNRGMLCNIGFLQYSDYCDYVCFHDVDMICSPIDYGYFPYPKCLLSKRSRIGNVTEKYFSGVVTFPREYFLHINGYSNEYWGWGCEDDDLVERCSALNVLIFRDEGYCADLDLLHSKLKVKNNPNYHLNNQRLKLLQQKNNNEKISLIIKDGLNNCKFDLISTTENSNHTHIIVSI